MPQITKIRVVNWKYDHTSPRKLIPDITISIPEGGNLLMEAGNGVGKTTILFAMFQCIAPRTKVGATRKDANKSLPDFFQSSADHSYVLIEYKLDNSEEYLMIGVSLYGVSKHSEMEATRGDYLVDYYNFWAKYKDPENDKFSVKNLELSKEENGVFIPKGSNYVKEILTGAAKQFYSSRETKKWKEFLRSFNIYAEDIQFFAKLARLEAGGAAKEIFGSEYNTSKDLFEKLFIRSIIEKIEQGNAIVDENQRSYINIQTMLEELLDGYIQKQSMMGVRDIYEKCNPALAQIRESIVAAKAASEERDAAVQELDGFIKAAESALYEVETECAALEKERVELSEQFSHIKWEEASAKCYECHQQWDALNTQKTELVQEQNRRLDSQKQYEHEKKVLLCAEDYRAVRDCETKIRVCEEKRDRQEKNDSRKASLRYTLAGILHKNKSELDSEIKSLTERKIALEKKLKELRRIQEQERQQITEDTAEINRTRGEWEKTKEQTDAYSEELGETSVTRQMDLGMAYDTQRVKAVQEQIQCEITGLKQEIKKAGDKIREIEETSLPALNREQMQVELRISRLDDSKENSELELAEYSRLEESIGGEILEKYGMDFSDLYGIEDGKPSPVAEYLSDLAEKERKQSYRIDAEMKKQQAQLIAAREGKLHLSTEIRSYMNKQVGNNFTTCESFLSRIVGEGLISADACMELLRRQPEMAYGVVMDAKTLEKFKQERERESWLPALLPIYSYDSVARYLQQDGEEEKKSGVDYLIADYMEDAFLNGKEVIEGINCNILKLMTEREQVLQSVSVYEQELRRVKEFASQYPRGYRAQKTQEIETVNKELRNQKQQKNKLTAEEKELNQNLKNCRATVANCENHVRDNNDRLRVVAKLVGSIEAERNLVVKIDRLREELSRKKENCNGRDIEIEKNTEDEDSARRELKAKKDTLRHLSDYYEKVKNARPADILYKWEDVTEALLEDMWLELAERSKTQNETVQIINSEIEKNRALRGQYLKNIKERGVAEDEFGDVTPNPDRVEELCELLKKVEQEIDENTDAVSELTSKEDKARIQYMAQQQTTETTYGSVLPVAEIKGKNFSERKEENKEKRGDNKKRSDEINQKKGKLEKVNRDAQRLLTDYPEPSEKIAVVLQKDIVVQLKEIQASVTESEGNMKREKTSYTDALDRLFRQTSLDAERGKIKRELLPLLNGMDDMRQTMINSGEVDRILAHIDSMIHSVGMGIDKLNTELAHLGCRKTEITNEIFRVESQVLLNLQALAKSSNISTGNAMKPMFRIKNILKHEPDAEYQAQGKRNIEQKFEMDLEWAMDKIRLGQLDETQKKQWVRSVSSVANQFYNYIQTSNVPVEVLAIDENGSQYLPWEKANNKSSGGKSLCGHCGIIISLLKFSHMTENRRDNPYTTLYLDNPFGAMSLDGLLDPIFELGRRNNVQFIFTSQFGSTKIESRFESVVALRMAKTKSNVNKMMCEQTKCMDCAEYQETETPIQTTLF